METGIEKSGRRAREIEREKESGGGGGGWHPTMHG